MLVSQSKYTPRLKEMIFLPEYDSNFVPTKFIQLFQKANMARIMANVQKRLNGASAEADFWYGENQDHVEKKSSE